MCAKGVLLWTWSPKLAKFTAGTMPGFHPRAQHGFLGRAKHDLCCSSHLLRSRCRTSPPVEGAASCKCAFKRSGDVDALLACKLALFCKRIVTRTTSHCRYRSPWYLRLTRTHGADCDTQRGSCRRPSSAYRGVRSAEEGGGVRGGAPPP